MEKDNHTSKKDPSKSKEKVPTAADADKSNNRALQKTWPYIFGLAILILIAYAVFLVFMIDHANLGLSEQEQVQWSRLVFLFSGVEAIVFTAVGFVFGKEVHRKEAVIANKMADKADDKADKEEVKKQSAQENHKEAEKATIVAQAETKIQFERGLVVANILRSQLNSNSLGIANFDGRENASNELLSQIEAWFPQS